jgi:fructokinase
MIQIGVDFGGTKIEAAALDARGAFLARIRAPNPGSYPAALQTVRRLVLEVESVAGDTGTVGIGVPGSISPRSGVMRNANSVWLNGRNLRDDLSGVLDRPVRIANDANCLAVSEAADGAAAESHTVFAAVLGTGCGGGLVIKGSLIEGANGIAGEWGHIPLPSARDGESAAPLCWCGRAGCLETWISGSGLERDHRETYGMSRTSEEIVRLVRAADPAASASFDLYLDRLGRALATVCNVVDPDTIVLGGGLSNVTEIYAALPAIVARYVFSDIWTTRLVAARWGDSSGVRGAARLWSRESL